MLIATAHGPVYPIVRGIQRLKRIKIEIIPYPNTWLFGIVKRVELITIALRNVCNSRGIPANA